MLGISQDSHTASDYTPKFTRLLLHFCNHHTRAV